MSLTYVAPTEGAPTTAEEAVVEFFAFDDKPTDFAEGVKVEDGRVAFPLDTEGRTTLIAYAEPLGKYWLVSSISACQDEMAKLDGLVEDPS
jgi:hypothetical protein